MASVTSGSDVYGYNHTGAADETQHSAGITEKGKEKAKQLGGVAKEKAQDQLESYKGQLTSMLEGLAGSLEKAKEHADDNLSQKALDTAAGYVRRTCDRLNQHSTDELMHQMRDQVREKPALFVAGLVGVGFFAGRLLRS
jgi:ElaB/YqjD/DUF883 family membrane-anchored ribosome-binding protein